MIKETGLSGDILSALKNIFQKYTCIEKVALYGSRAKGAFNERSDIDLIVYGQDVDRFVINQIIMDIDDSNIPYLVDLQSFHELKNHQLIDHIKRVGLVVYARN